MFACFHFGGIQHAHFVPSVLGEMLHENAVASSVAWNCSCPPVSPDQPRTEVVSVDKQVCSQRWLPPASTERSLTSSKSRGEVPKVGSSWLMEAQFGGHRQEAHARRALQWPTRRRRRHSDRHRCLRNKPSTIYNWRAPVAALRQLILCANTLATCLHQEITPSPHAVQSAQKRGGW